MVNDAIQESNQFTYFKLQIKENWCKLDFDNIGLESILILFFPINVDSRYSALQTISELYIIVILTN